MVTYMLPGRGRSWLLLLRVPQDARSVDGFRGVATRYWLLISKADTGTPLRWSSPATVGVLDVNTVGAVGSVQVGVVAAGHSAIAIGLPGQIEVDLSRVHDILSLHLHLLSLSLSRVVRLPHPLLMSVATSIRLQSSSLALPSLLCGLDHFTPPQFKEVVGICVELQSILSILQRM